MGGKKHSEKLILDGERRGKKNPAVGNGKHLTCKSTQILHSETGVGRTLKLLQKAKRRLVSLLASSLEKRDLPRDN